MSWFAAVHGTFNMSNSNGLFLWSRTMSFAHCQVIKPPADLHALCPDAQPGPLARADPALRALPKRYLWNHRIWAWRNTTSGFVPDTAAFTLANNERALRFAIKAIEAQPVAYAKTIAAEAVEPFTKTDDTLRFPVIEPRRSSPTFSSASRRRPTLPSARSGVCRQACVKWSRPSSRCSAECDSHGGSGSGRDAPLLGTSRRFDPDLSCSAEQGGFRPR